MEGMVMETSPIQFAKTKSSILVSPLPMITVSRLSQSQKAYSLTFLTLSGMVTLRILSLSLNASVAISITVEGITTSVFVPLYERSVPEADIENSGTDAASAPRGGSCTTTKALIIRITPSSFLIVFILNP